MSETPAAPVPGSDEYNAAMAAKGRGEPAPAATTTTSIPAKPDIGRDKFYDAKTGVYNWEAHAKEDAYRAAQGAGKQGGEPAGAGTSEPPRTVEIKDADPKDGAGDKDGGEVADVVAKAGLKVEDLATQIRDGGKITDEAKQALVKQGLPEALIDEYVSLAKYRMEAETQAVLTYAGGQDSWNELSAWAAKNLSDAEKTSFNNMLQGDGWKAAIDTLKTKRAAASKTAGEGNLTTTSGSNLPGGVGYRSRAEMKKDMADPRYSSDPAFRKQVEAKMQAATWDLDAR